MRDRDKTELGGETEHKGRSPMTFRGNSPGRHRVIIVGAGFGGLWAVKPLKGAPPAFARSMLTGARWSWQSPSASRQNRKQTKPRYQA